MIYLVIARQKYRYVSDIYNKISKSEWIDVVENTGYFTWYEDTELGKEYYDNFPEVEKKIKAVHEYDQRGKYFKVIAYFSDEYGNISFDLPRMTKARLLILYNLANQLNALLLKNGSKEIDLAFISALKK